MYLLPRVEKKFGDDVTGTLCLPPLMIYTESDKTDLDYSFKKVSQIFRINSAATAENMRNISANMYSFTDSTYY